MTQNNTLDTRVLGQILLLQSSLHSAPDEIRLGEQVCYTLISVPGVSASALYINDKVVANTTSSSEMITEWPLSWTEIVKQSSADNSSENPFKLIPLQTSKMTYGCISLALADNEIASYYIPFLENTANQIALLLENRKHEADLRTLNATLEAQVKDRTKALTESEELFRSTFESAAIGMCLTSIDGNFQMVNPKLCKILKYSEEELLSKNFADFTYPDDIAISIEKVKYLLNGKAKNTVFEKRYVNKTGRVIWTSVGTYLVRDDKGKPQYFVTHIEDITDKKQAEASLRESEQFYRNLFDYANEGLFLMTLDGKLKEVNQAFADMHGYTTDELRGIDIQTIDVLKKETLKERADFIHRIHAGEIVRFEAEHYHKDGHIIYLNVTTSLILFGAEKYFLAFHQDVTERKEIAVRLQQAQKMESIGNLAGGIAHDFNNILFPIVGLSELLIEDLPPGGPEHENAQEILKAGKRGSDLVQQILTFSRQSEHKRLPVRPQQILQEVLKLSRSTIPTNIKIRQYIQHDCGMIMANPIKIHQIGMNLITNAYHAVDQSNGEISVELKEINIGVDDLPGNFLEAGRYAMLTVSDTGCGIEPDLMDQIFEPYFTTKEQNKGTGLGLAVVYGIVKKQDGDIKVSSEVGKGTTFKVYLPLMDKDPAPATPELLEKVPNGSERILLVDDEEAVVRLEKQLFERLGYHVTDSTSSIEALKVFLKDPSAYDLVVSDMAMPNMTGDQLARELTAIRPDVPIIICTGFSERINKEKAEIIGIKGFLMKPVVKSEMARIVRKVLDEVKATSTQD